MFVTQAHSFVQQARLAITLAWIAGCTNVISILACSATTSHVSGNTSQFGIHAVEAARGKPGAFTNAIYLLFLLAAFGLGSFLSGVSTEFGRRKRWESIYVLPMTLEALMLSAFAIAIEWLPAGTSSAPWVAGVAAMAMGLQNATITRISNGVVRTTHVTGVLTDLGMEAGAAALSVLRHENRSIRGVVRAGTGPTARRLAVLASILGSFALGAGLGAAMFELAPRLAMFPPVIFLLWIVYQDVARPIAEIEPSEMIQMIGLDLPAAIDVLHLRPDARRSGVQRLPSYTTWIDRLKPAVRVAILDLTDIRKLSANSVEELIAAAAVLARSGRRLLIAGVTPAQYRELHAADRDRIIAPTDVLPDLELAIAHGLNVAAGGRGH